MKRIIYLLMFVLLISYVSAASLSVFYNCDEGSGSNIIDQQNNRNGTGYDNLFNTSVPSYNTSGSAGTSSCQLNGGDDDRIDVPNTLDALINFDDGFSISSWVRQWGYGEQQYLFAPYGEKRIIAGFDAWSGNANVAQFAVDYTSWASCSSSNNLSDNQWHHLAFVAKNETANYRILIYEDGIEVCNATHAIADIDAGADSNRIGHSGNLADNLEFIGLFDDFKIYDDALNTTEINNLFNYGNITGTASVPAAQNISINITYPYQDLIINEHFFVNVTCNNSCTCSINDTSWGENFSNNTAYSFLNDTYLADGNYHVKVNCSAGGGMTDTQTRKFVVDLTDPTITPKPSLLYNDTWVWNGTLSTYINFSDNNEIYSIKVNMSNGTNIFSKDNMGVTFYRLNISESIGYVVSDYFNVTLCDAHTALAISSLDTKVSDQGLKYVMEEKFFIDTEWVKIYPKEYALYDTPETVKAKDRYNFTFHRKEEVGAAETFVVESSHYIDIAKLQNYGGHLVIPDIGKNGYWVDLVNDDATKYTITRINDKKVEITVYGLKGTTLSFSSIGELNCVTTAYYYGNINPSTTFTPRTTGQTTTTFYLNITTDAITMENITATLHYNNTAYSAGSIANFSVDVTTPDVRNFTNISFVWQITIDSESHNLTTYEQTVYDWYLDNCSNASILAYNFTVKDEKTDFVRTAEIDGTFNFTVPGGSAYKQFTVDYNDASNMQICMYPAWGNLTGSYTLAYSKQTAFPERSYKEAIDANNITKNKVLYLLNTTYGLYANFRVMDPYGTSLGDVNSSMYKTIDGSPTKMEERLTDDSGSVSFFQNPDDTYTFYFVKDGYESTSYNLRVTTTEIISIYLGGQSVNENLSYGSGISYSFNPTIFTLNNGTNYTFMFNLTSDYWTVTSCTLTLLNGSTTITSGSGYTTTTCGIDIPLNTDGYSTITSQVTYYLNGTELNVSRDYSILYTYEGDSSLKNFLDDVKDFGDWGFNDFTRMLIALVITIGALYFTASSKFAGIQEEEPLIIMTIVITWFFSYIGFYVISFSQIPTPFLQKYMIFILVTLTGGGYLVKKHIE